MGSSQVYIVKLLVTNNKNCVGDGLVEGVVSLHGTDRPERAMEAILRPKAPTIGWREARQSGLLVG